jgi:hypothetical protein
MNSGGAKINNSVAHHGSPSLSPDGKFLFFIRHGIITDMEIYWVSTSIIDVLRKYAFAPKLSTPIRNMTINADSLFNYQVPENTFSCEYGTDSLKYSATLSNGSDLPSWLHFDSDTKTFSGTPRQAEIDIIKITATNKDSTSVSCTFRITVTNPTGIEKDNNQLPKESELLQNYPNPFNPSTVINYRLPESCNAKLVIYDTLGREIKILVNSFQHAGEHSIVWNGMDELNSQVSSGVYFYRLESGNLIIHKKMTLIR